MHGRTRGGGSLAAALLLSLLGGALPAVALDIVRLKDGQVLQGRVEDHGTYILVHRALDERSSGTVRIERNEILSIELDQTLARPGRQTDMVVLQSGEELRGRVELREQGRRVVVVRERGEVALDRQQVRAIVWADRDGNPQTAPAPVSELLEQLFGELASEDAEVRRRALDRLFALAGLVEPYLRARDLSGQAEPVRAAVAEVLRAAAFEKLLPPVVQGRLPGLARRLIAAEVEARLKALREAVVVAGGDAAPLLLEMARQDTSAEVRAFCLGQLSLLGRIDELLDLVRSGDGNLRFAAAIALGDNGVYVGVPLVIEGLRHESVAIRKLAIEKLEAWTGQFLGYFPDDDPERRAAAVARWEQWFAEQGRQFVDDSLRATIARDEVTEDDKTEGRALWVEALRVWQAAHEARADNPEERRRRLLHVRVLLERSLSRYPQFTNARLALAELLYRELDEFEAARRELQILLDRYGKEGGRQTRYLAHLHLGRLARRAGKLEEAEEQLRRALTADPGGVEAALELGELYLQQALAPGETPAAERRALLDRAVEVYSGGIRHQSFYLQDLGQAMAAADEDLDRAAPFVRGRVVGQMGVLQEQARARSAQLLFARARAYAAQGRDQEAAADYAAAASYDPDNPEYARAAELWGAAGRPAAAVPPAGAAGN